MKRGRYEIIEDILNICKDGGANKTRIVYRANLNFKNAGIYIDFLILRGMIVKDGNKFKTSMKGLELVSAMKDIKDEDGRWL